MLGVGSIIKKKKILLLLALSTVTFSLATILQPEMTEKSFAVETFYVGAYWDQACTQPVRSIKWGELTPGSTSQESIFLRNEQLQQSCFMSMNTRDWNPPEAVNYLSVDWDYNDKNVELGETVPVTLTLRVAREVHGITDFNFTTIIFGTEYILGDINEDGIVNIYDVVELTVAYNTTLSDPLWNPQADLNNDNVINVYDMVILVQNYKRSSL